ncbi:MAG: CoA transferase [Chloroflexi bacterium]|nr:CoA transferase [Chloroflexota bacterium]
MAQQKVPALKGLKVLEWGIAQFAPAATRCLSDFGAQVIKIESTETPDVLRQLQPQVKGLPPLDNAPGFTHFNTGKMSLTLDLSQPRGVDIFKRLAVWADIVVQNQRPGAMEKLGLGYEDLKKLKPDIIMVNGSVAGQEGPGKKVRGWGFHTSAISGVTFLTGYPGKEPLFPGWNVPADVLGSLFLTIACLAALRYKARTGKGQCIDATQLEPMVHILGASLLDLTANGRPQERIGNRHPYASPHGAFRCKGDDQWCTIAVFSDEEWRAFCEVLGNPAWTREAAFATLESRKKNEDELEKKVEEWTLNYPPQEVMDRLQSKGVPAGKVQRINEIMTIDPQVKQRGVYREVNHPLIGRFLAPAWPFILSETPCEIRHGPLIGQDNNRIITEILGMSDAELVELVNSKVLS